MDDGEGSVMVDGVDAAEESAEETKSTTENINNQVEESSEQKKDTTAKSDSSDTTSETDTTVDEEKKEETQEGEDKTKPDEGKEEKTEKGTKLDPDPLSRANQLRANAEKEARGYYGLLNDPIKLEAYLQELKTEKGLTKVEAQTGDALKNLDPDKLETVEDLRGFAKGLKEATAKEIDSVKKQVFGLTSSQQVKETAGRIQGGITEVQTKYPELREFNTDGSKNPEYNGELDDLIGQLFQELDLDKRSGQYRGQVNIMSIADRIMGARRIGEGRGARKAKTDVIDKRSGRVITSQTDGGAQRPDESKLSPSATIAERMKRAANKR